MSWKALDVVAERSRSRGTDRLVALFVAEAADHDGEMTIDLEHVARRANVTRQTARRSVTALVEIGELEVLSEKIGYYRLTLVSALGEGDPKEGEGSSSASSASETKEETDPSSDLSDGLTNVRVDGKPISDRHAAIATSVLRAFNRAVGADPPFTFKGKHNRARTAIVMRIREHPELGVSDFEQIIDRAVHASPGERFWEGTPPPAVLFGNATLFERWMQRGAARGRRVQDGFEWDPSKVDPGA